MIPNRLSLYLTFLVLLALAIATGFLAHQGVLLRRVERRLARLEESAEVHGQALGKLRKQAELDEEYRRLRWMDPHRRELLYPASSTFRPGRDTLEAFRDKLREDLARWTGLDRALLEQPVRFELGEEVAVDSGGVRCRRIEFGFAGHDRWTLRGYLLEPREAAGLLPSVFCLNGHEGQARAIAGLAADYTNGFGLALAATGLRVLTFDWAFEQESSLLGSQGEPVCGHDSLLVWAAANSTTGLALYLENAACALKVLQQLPGGDPSRIGVTGISRGGELTSYTAAMFGDELACYYASGAGFPFSYRRYDGGCRCTRVDSIFDHYEYTDLLVAAAPLPGRVQLGLADEIYGYRDNVDLIVTRLGGLYRELGLPEDFGMDYHPGGHIYEVPSAVRFFRKALPAS